MKREKGEEEMKKSLFLGFIVLMFVYGVNVSLAAATATKTNKIIFQANFKQRAISPDVWTYQSGKFKVEKGILRLGGGELKAEIELSSPDWILEFRAKYTSPVVWSAEKIGLVNEDGDMVSLYAQSKNLWLMSNIAGKKPAAYRAYANDFKFHTFKIEKIAGNLLLFQDNELKAYITKQVFNDDLWVSFFLKSSHAKYPLSVDWIKLSKGSDQQGLNWIKKIKEGKGPVK